MKDAKKANYLIIFLIGLFASGCADLASEHNLSLPTATVENIFPTETERSEPVLETNESPDEDAIHPQADISWNILFEITGGLLGKDVSLYIDDMGLLEVTDHKNSTHLVGSIPPSEVEQIALLMTQTSSVSSGEKLPACADCFIYTIQIKSDDLSKPRNYMVNDVNIKTSGLEELVTTLTALMERALSGEFGS